MLQWLAHQLSAGPVGPRPVLAATYTDRTCFAVAADREPALSEVEGRSRRIICMCLLGRSWIEAELYGFSLASSIALSLNIMCKPGNKGQEKDSQAAAKTRQHDHENQIRVIHARYKAGSRDLKRYENQQ